MRWLRSRSSRVTIVGLTCLFLLPVSVGATGMPMTDRPMALSADMAMAGGLDTPVATDSPMCAACYLAPTPVARPLGEPEGEKKTTAWADLAGGRSDTAGSFVLLPRPVAIPLRIAHCRWMN